MRIGYGMQLVGILLAFVSGGVLGLAAGYESMQTPLAFVGARLMLIGAVGILIEPKRGL